jgi:hypothetical protein
MLNPLTVLVVLFGILGLLSFIISVSIFRKKRILSGAMAIILGLLFLALAGLFGAITVGIQGYRTLVREELAAVVRIEPAGPQKFSARIRLADGWETTFFLAGDEIYVDARILKWKPIVNFFGLHTAYELDRVAGRYALLEDEQSKPRTVFSLSKNRPVDLFNLRRKYSLLTPLVDAEYGSATFVAAGKPARIEVRVSTTGLLIRPLSESGLSY